MSNNHKNSKPNLRSNSGQAVLETVLVLLIVVSMARLVWGLNNNVREWGFSYFGDYFLCLIEVGELPSLGGANTAGECNGAYQEFDFASGRPPVGGGGSTSSGLSGSSDEPGGSAGSSESSRAASDSADTSRNSGNGSRTRISSSSINNNGGSSGKVGAKKKAKEEKIKVDESEGIPAWALNKRDRAAAGRPDRIAVSSKYSIDDDSQQKRGAERTNVTVKTKSSQDEEGRTKKMKVRERKAASVEANDGGGFSFGRLLRMLIILGIIVAIVVFFGSQALQISKDSE